MLSFLGTGNVAVNRNKTPDFMVLRSNWRDRWNMPERSKYSGEKQGKKEVGSQMGVWYNLKEGVQGTPHQE